MKSATRSCVTLGLASAITLGLAAQSSFDVVEWHAMSLRARGQGTSVTLMAKTPDDVFVVNGVSFINTAPLRKICPAEAKSNPDPVFDQPAMERCTAFLVAPDRVATAGHCVEQAAPAVCQAGASATNLRFVFGFQMTNGTTASTPAVNDFYAGKKVIACSRSDADDWAVIELDGVVKGRTPLKVDGSSALPNGAAVSYIGHPLGLPLKQLDGVVLESSATKSFAASLKSTSGASGSPVFDSSGVVVGLVRRSIVPAGGPAICLRLRSCQGASCVTTEVTRARLFEAAITK
jgi:V8-like Glu-specific endopeptidase